MLQVKVCNDQGHNLLFPKLLKTCHKSFVKVIQLRPHHVLPEEVANQLLGQNYLVPRLHFVDVCVDVVCFFF